MGTWGLDYFPDTYIIPIKGVGRICHDILACPNQVLKAADVPGTPVININLKLFPGNWGPLHHGVSGKPKSSIHSPGVNNIELNIVDGKINFP